MKSWLVLVVVLASACTAGDDTASGARSRCAEGGALNACPDGVPTPQGACWRMVDCGAISISSADPTNHFDWGDCVDRIEGSTTVAQTLIVNCIVASTCDALKVQGSPDDPREDQMACFHLGGR
jgi:hypothetical protein